MARLLVHADFKLLVIVILLVLYGAVMIYSCTHQRLAQAGLSPARKVTLQLVWIGLGILIMALVMVADYAKLASFSPIIYLLCLGLLVLVLVIAQVRLGAIRWIPLGPLRIQPAELTKLGVILMLGTYLAGRREEGEHDAFPVAARALVYVAVPAALIALQPDLGTPVVLVFICLVMLYVGGARLSHLAAFAFAFLMLLTAAWGLDIIRPHQKERLTSFLHPEDDPEGSGWHVRQSLIAIGSGHLYGQGFKQGTQTQGNFIPHQEEDFIFTAVAEELGLFGSLLLLGLLAALLARAVIICIHAEDINGRLVAAGIAAMFLVHIVASVGMTMGLLPVKGMTLPFVSYGGSSMMVSFAGVGLLQSIYMRRHKIAF